MLSLTSAQVDTIVGPARIAGNAFAGRVSGRKPVAGFAVEITTLFFHNERTIGELVGWFGQFIVYSELFADAALGALVDGSARAAVTRCAIQGYSLFGQRWQSISMEGSELRHFLDLRDEAFLPGEVARNFRMAFGTTAAVMQIGHEEPRCFEVDGPVCLSPLQNAAMRPLVELGNEAYAQRLRAKLTGHEIAEEREKGRKIVLH